MLEPAPDRLTLGRKLGFTLGDYASNLYWQSVSLFLLFFYTDAVGLPAATAGLIYMIASIFDGAIDPLMGMVADRTRTRWGRYRPYLLFGAVPLALSFVLLYVRPPLEGLALAAWMLVAHMVFRVAYTTVSIPYTSLNARITESSSERSTLAGLRMIFATLAAFTVAALTQPVADLAGGAPARGFMAAAALFAIVATLIYPLVFLVVREPAEPAVAPPPLTLREQWAAVRGNRAFWIVMAGISLGLICSTALGKSVLYYFKYYLHDPAAAKLALPLFAGVGLVIIPAWIVVSRRVGKRTAWLITTCWNLAGLLVFALVDIRSAPLMMAFLVYMQVGNLGAAMTFWSMLPDTVEYGEWRTGLRAEAFIFGLGQFFLKAALGLGAGLFGWALGAVGYAPNQPQTPETLAGLKDIMVVLPMVGVAGAGLAMLFYPLGRGDHEAIVRDLRARPSGARRPGPASAPPVGEELYET
jgi:GPH family glycoside/pentoside/hexuronide:cation symporter